MKNIKKFLALVLALVLSFSVIACSQGERARQDQPAGETKALTSSEPDNNEDAKLTYWDMLWSDDEAYEGVVNSLAQKFTDKTGVEVEVQIIPWDNHYQTFLTAINSGAAPDVCTGGAFQAIQYAAMDAVLALDSIIEEWKNDGSDILDDFVPGSLELQRYNGMQVGIPWNSDVRILYYRTDYLEDAGYTGEDAWGVHTFEEFLDMLRAVKKAHPEVIPFVFPAGDYTATHTMMSFSAANNAGITDKEYKANLTSPEMIEVLEFFKTMKDEGLVAESAATMLGSDIERLYASGNAAVVWSGNPTYLREYLDVREVTDLMQPVVGPSGSSASILVWTNPMIAFNQTEYPEQAKQFIKFWIENNLSVYTEGKTGALPVRQSFLEDEYFTSAWLPAKIHERKLLSFAASPVYPAESLYPEIADIEGNNIVGEMLQRVLLGESDLQTIASDANAKVEEALKLITNPE